MEGTKCLEFLISKFSEAGNLQEQLMQLNNDKDKATPLLCAALAENMDSVKLMS